MEYRIKGYKEMWFFFFFFWRIFTLQDLDTRGRPTKSFPDSEAALLYCFVMSYNYISLDLAY